MGCALPPAVLHAILERTGSSRANLLHETYCLYLGWLLVRFIHTYPCSHVASHAASMLLHAGMLLSIHIQTTNAEQVSVQPDTTRGTAAQLLQAFISSTLAEAQMIADSPGSEAS